MHENFTVSIKVSWAPVVRSICWIRQPSITWLPFCSGGPAATIRLASSAASPTGGEYGPCGTVAAIWPEPDEPVPGSGIDRTSAGGLIDSKKNSVVELLAKQCLAYPQFV